MTWTRHENGAGATPTFGRRRQRRRADQLRSAAAASAKCRRRRGGAAAAAHSSIVWPSTAILLWQGNVVTHIHTHTHTHTHFISLVRCQLGHGFRFASTCYAPALHCHHHTHTNLYQSDAQIPFTSLRLFRFTSATKSASTNHSLGLSIIRQFGRKSFSQNDLQVKIERYQRSSNAHLNWILKIADGTIWMYNKITQRFRNKMSKGINYWTV